MAARGKKNVDDVIVLALAGGASIAKAAEQAGCSESTARRRMADAAFRAKVHEQRSEMIAAAVGKLATMGATAADELQRLIQDGKDDNIKLGACRAVLTHMLAGHEHEVLVQQLHELRSKVEELEHAGHDPQRSETLTGADSEPGDKGDAAACGANPSGSGAGDDPGRDEAGPVASQVAEGQMDESLAPLFPAEREEPNGRSAGAG